MFQITLILTLISSTVCQIQPEQVHIAVGDQLTEMVIMWVTQNDTEISVVEYGMGKIDSSASSRPKAFTEKEVDRIWFIHNVKLTNLQQDTTYIYRCGSPKAWSTTYQFKTLRLDPNWSPSLALFGDLGYENAKALGQLQKEAQDGLYDMVFHFGDIAYELQEQEGRTGDNFMKQIEPIAAVVPYMVGPGNHEQANNFSHYIARFTMPGGTDNMYYSLNLGPVHLISFSSEYYYTDDVYTSLHIQYQYEWLEKDLKRATLPKSRQERPWIVTMAHQPMYCSTHAGQDCSNINAKIRIGMPTNDGLKYGLEKLFHDYQVDLAFWGHEHVYERAFPTFDYKVYNGSTEEPYTNAKAPIHIISGSAGGKHGLDPWIDEPGAWSALRNANYTYTRMKIFNKTHLYFEQYSMDEDRVFDEVWVIKNDLTEDCSAQLDCKNSNKKH